MTPISLGIFASANTTVGTSYESIATVTVGSGGAANVEFTSIPGTYTHLQVRAIGRTTSTNNNILLTLNSDSTDGNYYHHHLYGNGSAAAATASQVRRIMYWPISSDTASSFGAGVIDILDYANTNKYKTSRALQGFDTNGGGLMFLTSNLWMNTNAVTTVKIEPAGGNFAQYSHFALYGIKSA